MTDQDFYFFEIDRVLPITDYQQINVSLKEQKALFRYGRGINLLLTSFPKEMDSIQRKPLDVISLSQRKVLSLETSSVLFRCL